MKSLFSYLTLFCFLLVSMVSCVSKKPSDPVIVTKTKTIKEVVKDTIFKIEKDSSYYKAFVECRDGKPILITSNLPSGEKTAIVKKGKYLNTPNVNLSKDGALTVNCVAEAQELFARWKDTYINEQEPIIIKVPTEIYKESLAPWYVKLQLWAGRLLLLAIIVVLGVELFNLIKKK